VLGKIGLDADGPGAGCISGVAPTGGLRPACGAVAARRRDGRGDGRWQRPVH